MPLNWIDTTCLSFNSLLLLERVQLSWLPGWVPDPEMAQALKANPVVEWYLRHKCPETAPWLDRLTALETSDSEAQSVYAAEQRILQTINDLLVYVIDPSIYDSLPFLGWDSAELTSLVDFEGKFVIDVGSGTGRLAFAAAVKAAAVFAVEPVENLRRYIKEKALRTGFKNVFPVDGLITDIPFPNGFADVTIGGHVFGDDPEGELHELERVTKAGGMVILCPGHNDLDTPPHGFIIGHDYQWSRFEEPGDGWKRKYWKVL